MEKPSKTMPCAMNSRFSPFQKKSKNRCQNDLQKSWKMHQNGGPERLGSIYSSFLCISGDVEKKWFFEVVPGRPKKRKIEPCGAQGSILSPRVIAKGSPSAPFWARRVPGAASRARTSEEKNDRGAIGGGSDTPWAQRSWPGEFICICSSFF